MSTNTRPAIDGWFTIDDPPALVGASCPGCRTVVFPPTPGPCPNPYCEETELARRPLSRTGTIWSFTDAQYQPPPPYIPRTDPYEPFAIAAVELDGEGLVVLGQLADGVGTADIAVGDAVELVIGPLYSEGDDEVVIWKWCPIEMKETNDV